MYEFLCLLVNSNNGFICGCVRKNPGLSFYLKNSEGGLRDAKRHL